MEKIWGKVQPATAGEKQARIGGVVSILKMGRGNVAAGKSLFQQTCALCHTLFGEGKQIGPDLTGTDRKNLDFLLSNIVDPSGYIRAEYVAYNLATKDDRLLTGLIAEQTPQTVTLLDAANQRTTVARSDIKELSSSPMSLMPEGILDALEPQQIRDLIAYIQSDAAK
jgi:putative heme-binding domain-containing protein